MTKLTKLTDLDFSRAAGMGERIAAAGNVGYWVTDDAVLALQRKKITDCLHELAALHGLVLVPAAEHQTIENLHAVIKDHHVTIRGLMDADTHADSKHACGLNLDFTGTCIVCGATSQRSHAADAALAGIKSADLLRHWACSFGEEAGAFNDALDELEKAAKAKVQP